MRSEFKTLLLIFAVIFSTISFAQTKVNDGKTEPKKAQNLPAESTSVVNLRIHPLRLIKSVISANLDLAVHPNLTFGLDLVYWHRATGSGDDLTKTTDILGYGVGGRFNWFFEGVYLNGFYAGASFDYAAQKKAVKDLSKSSTTTTSSYSSTLVGGYAWFFESFNIMLGGGWTVPITTSPYSFQDASGYVVRRGPRWTTAQWTLEFTTGWTF